MIKQISLSSLFVALIITAPGCGAKSNSSTNASVNSPSNYSPVTSGPNVMPVTVGKSTVCGQNVVSGQTYSNPNEPCTSVTICVPGTSNCQTISDVLVDTGSTGLRLFSSVVTLSLTTVTVGSSQIAECANFGSGSDWGPIATAQINLASEPSVQTSIQLINANYATVPSVCKGSDTAPSEAGFNGILGVGLFKQDCGDSCAKSANQSMYYSCSGSNCATTTLPVTTQLQNPIALLPTDNNGLIFELPNLTSASGSTSVTGSIVLGIGTESNNSPSGATEFAANGEGNFDTNYNNSNQSGSFIDSGSNGLFFSSNITTCSSGFYCPSSTESLSAIISGTSGSPQTQINFQIANESTLTSNGNLVFNNLGGSVSIGGFDWGLPFFFGRKVYVGIESQTSSLGTGPYWAF